MLISGNGSLGAPVIRGSAARSPRLYGGNARDNWWDVTSTLSERIVGGTTANDGDAIVRPSQAGTVFTDRTFAVHRMGVVGAITYLSSNPAVASIDAQGRLTHVADGTVNITISDALNVRAPLVIPLTLTSRSITQPLIVGGQVGTVRKDATDSINTRLVGKNPVVAKPLFSVRDPITPSFVWNVDSWLAGVDLTFLSPWNSRAGNLQPVTLVAPDIVLMATHWHFDQPGDVWFVKADGTIVSRSVVDMASLVGFNGIYPDVTIGRLNSPVPAGITPVKILPADWLHRLPHVAVYFPAGNGVLVPLVVVDQDKHATVHDASLGLEYFDGGSGGRFATGGQSADPTRASFYESVIEFDSGHPMFIVLNGTAVLLSLLTTGQAWGTALTAVRAAVNAVITALGSSSQLSEYDMSGYTYYA